MSGSMRFNKRRRIFNLHYSRLFLIQKTFYNLCSLKWKWLERLLGHKKLKSYEKREKKPENFLVLKIFLPQKCSSNSPYSFCRWSAHSSSSSWRTLPCCLPDHSSHRAVHRIDNKNLLIITCVMSLFRKAYQTCILVKVSKDASNRAV